MCALSTMKSLRQSKLGYHDEGFEENCCSLEGYRTTFTGWPKNGTIFVRLNFIKININRFSKRFHCKNQEKICDNTITKDPITPQVCRYTTLCPIKAPRRGVVP